MSHPHTRTILPPIGHAADKNTWQSHPAEMGSWIWHPECPIGQTAALRFTLRFKVDAACCPLLHFTADQRFQLRCDGQDLSFGPDRSDVEHWTVQSLPVDLEAGDHTLEATVWWLGEPPSGAIRVGDPNVKETATTALPPMAQMTSRGGFLLYTEDLDAPLLNTGSAAWQVENLTDAVELTRPPLPGYHDIGPSYEFDLALWSDQPETAATVTATPLIENGNGVMRPGPRLYPAVLPEQLRNSWAGGRIRALRSDWSESPFTETETKNNFADWQTLVDGGEASLQIPADTELSVIWDLEDYLCAYPTLLTTGGSGSHIKWDWAEALYEESDSSEVKADSSKGDRHQVIDKVFLGLGDSWKIKGTESFRLPTFWWRSGRYIRLSIKTADKPLTITKLGINTTRYPLEKTGTWESSDKEWDTLIPLFDKTLKSSAHETWTDCPYYEQLCYVGDTRLHCLSNYLWYSDDRISRRAITQFDWSRRESGLVTERYPSAWSQQSVTYAMLWPLMIRDFTNWRDDANYVRTLLPGMRSMLAELENLVIDGLMTSTPGWPFVDWVSTWDDGCGPGVRAGDSSIVNLHWVLCLQAAAEVEDAHGDSILAERCRKMADQAFSVTLERYWSAERGILLDTTGTDDASEHAQFFALLTGLLDDEKSASCLSALKDGTGLCKATIYATFYLLDALHKYGENEEIHKRLKFWRHLSDLGFSCTPEAPEPARSDSHAWGAHPMWHTLTTIAGVRSTAPGFASVRIAPCPGDMQSFDCSMVHPRGEIAYKMSFKGTTATGEIILPDGVTGIFEWQGKEITLNEGRNVIQSH